LEVREVRQPAVATTATTEMIVSPAAKALDYFEEALGTLGIRDSDGLTHEQLKAAYKRVSLTAHPDKPGGSAAKFDALRRAYQYVEKILDRVKPRISAEETARMTAPVSVESARKARALPDAPKIQLSAKKLDMAAFNQLFEENRLPDPTRDGGYGDWLKSQGGDDAVAADPRLKGKFNQSVFESVFQERAGRGADAIVRRTEPDALYAPGGTELGGDGKNFTSAMGSDTQFTDLKEAYTTGATVYQEIADVRVTERSATSVSEAKRMRDAAMSRVDPDEGSRIAAAAAALEERERQRRLRYAAEQTAAEEWDALMRSRLAVTDRLPTPVQQSRRR
jgi:curved DNA-binding protein CbpA